MAPNALALELPKNMFFTGDVVEGALVFSTSGERDTRALTLTVQGREEVAIRHGGKRGHTHRATADIVAWQIPFAGPGPIPPGIHRFPFQFQIPKNALPSYRGFSSNVRYTLKARLDVPLAFDTTQEWEVFVFYDRASVRRFARPVRFHSPGDKAAVYVEIDGERFFAGERIGCRITLMRVGKRRIRRVYVRLIGEEWARAGHAQRSYPTKHYETSIPFETIRTGAPFTFEIPIPPDLPSAYHGTHSHFGFYIQVGLDLAWARDVVATTPIVIVR